MEEARLSLSLSNDSSDDSEDDAEIFYYYYRYNKRNQYQRRFWVRPFLERSLSQRRSVVAKELQASDTKFSHFYRMSKDSYLELVKLLGPALSRQNTNMRECVNPEERLLITLRYLGTFTTYTSISLYFAKGETTVSGIVADTSKAIWNALKETHMKMPKREEWKSIAQEFESHWNMPHCIGAIDCKHIKIEKFANNKWYHRVVLIACCDADAMFTMIETGSGDISDADIFRHSAMKEIITNGHLDIPPPSTLRHDKRATLFPYYFVADDDFKLSRYLMRPYPKRSLNNRKRIFNYRLNQGRKPIECAFKMASKRFAILNGPIRIRKPDVVDYVIKAACVLSNYVRKRENVPCSQTADYFPEDSATTDAVLIRPKNMALAKNYLIKDLRDYLANYFLIPQASLPWQWKYATD